jgi:WD40 repeat protein
VAGGDHAEVYDPASGTWTATGKMSDQGSRTAAALLADGKVLVAGGQGFRLPNDYYLLDSAQVYDPVTGSWTATANMHAKAETAAAFPQPDGKVLVVGSVRGPNSHAEVYDPATGTWTELPVGSGIRYSAATLLSDGAVLVTGYTDVEPSACTADLYDPHTRSWTTASTMLGCGDGNSFTLLLDGTVLVAGGRSTCNDEGQCISNGAAALYVPAGVSLPPLPAFPSPPPPVFPSPTPVPTPLPPADGPVPPNARSWTVTVDNRSSEPATVFVADEAWDGLRLVGSATPNVVPARTTVKVTFLFPADGGWIYVNPRPGDGGGLVNADQIGIPGKILIRDDGEGGWLSP